MSDQANQAWVEREAALTERIKALEAKIQREARIGALEWASGQVFHVQAEEATMIHPAAVRASAVIYNQVSLGLHDKLWDEVITDEYTPLVEAAREMLDELGWAGRGERERDIFYCQFCGESHADASLIEHAPTCRMTKWSAELKEVAGA